MSRQPFAFHCARQVEAGCRMPSANTIERADRDRIAAAKDGSARLLKAMLIYGCTHGLPNIAAEECRARIGAPPMRPRRSYTRNDRWTESEDRAVLELRASRVSCSFIASRLSRPRSAAAVAARLKLLRGRGAAR